MSDLILDEDFKVGDVVYYGTLGKHIVSSLEKVSISGNELPFFRLNKIRVNPLFKPGHGQPFTVDENQNVLVPVREAKKKGLRHAASGNEIQQVFSILSDKEPYMTPTSNWKETRSTISQLATHEGLIGIAKAVSYFSALKNQQHILSAESKKLYESLLHALTKELAEVTGQNVKLVEEEVSKKIKNKSIPASNKSS